MQLKSFLTLLAIAAASLLHAQTGAEGKPYKYARKSYYDPGYQIIGRGDEYGMMDPNGTIIFPAEYRGVMNDYNVFTMDDEAYYHHNEAFVLKNRANKVGVIQNYKVAVPFEYDMIYVRQEDVNRVKTVNYVLVEKDNMVYSYDIITKQQSSVALGSKIIYMPEYMDRIYGGLVQRGNSIYTYNPGVGLEAINHDNPNTLMIVCYNGYYGLIDGRGRIVLPAEYNYIYSINMDGAIICTAKNGQQGVINAQGKEIVPFKYSRTALLEIYNPDTEEAFYAIEVEENGYIAIFDTLGNRLTDFKYKGIAHAYEGLDDRYGIYLEIERNSPVYDFLEIDGTITSYGR